MTWGYHYFGEPPLVEVVFHLWRFIENTDSYIRVYTIVCNSIYDSTLRITGPCYRGVWMCIAGVWDLQTISFEIPGSLAYIIHLFFLLRMYATKRITTFCNAKPSNWPIINTYRTWLNFHFGPTKTGHEKPYIYLHAYHTNDNQSWKAKNIPLFLPHGNPRQKNAGPDRGQV